MLKKKNLSERRTIWFTVIKTVYSNSTAQSIFFMFHNSIYYIHRIRTYPKFPRKVIISKMALMLNFSSTHMLIKTLTANLILVISSPYSLNGWYIRSTRATSLSRPSYRVLACESELTAPNMLSF